MGYNILGVMEQRLYILVTATLELKLNYRDIKTIRSTINKPFYRYKI